MILVLEFIISLEWLVVSVIGIVDCKLFVKDIVVIRIVILIIVNRISVYYVLCKWC